MIPALTTSSGPAAAVLVFAPLAAPLAAAATAAVLRWRRATGLATIGAAGIILAAGITAATRTVDGTAVAIGDWLRIDALSAVILIVIGAVGVVATCAGLGHLDAELERAHVDGAGA